MANVGTAVGTVVPSMDGFEARINRALSSVNASSSGRKIGSSLSSGIADSLGRGSSLISGAIGGIAVTAVSGLASAIGSLAGEMVEASDSADKFASTLSFAGIDTSTIEALTESTQAYADQTVYDLQDIRNVTAQLAANGVDNYAQLAEAAGNLNAVAGGNADTFRSVGMVMTQTAGSGKLMTENWNQLTDAIPGASGALQDAMASAGAFEGNFREAMEAGEISADEFFAAVQQLGMTDVAAQAATSTATIEGAMGNLRASVVGIGNDVITAFKPLITGAIGGVTDVINNVGTAVSVATGYMTNWSQKSQEVSAALGATATNGDVAASMITDMGTSLGATAEQMQPLASLVGGVVDTISAGFSQAAPYVEQARQALEGVGTTIASSVAPITQNLAGIVSQVIPVVASVASTIATVAGQIAAVVMPIVEQVTGLIRQNMPAIQATVTSAMSTIQSVISAVLPVIQGIWNTVWPAIQSVFSGVFSAIQTVVQTVMGVVQGVISTVTAVIHGDWQGAWEGIKSIFQSVWDGIKNIVTTVFNAVKGVITTVLDTIKGIWETVWGGIRDFLQSAWEGIKSGVSNGIDAVVGFFRDLPQNILNALGNLGSLLINAGKSIIDGLLNGIKSAFEGVKNFVSGIGSWIADHKGPLSYDRKLLVENGRTIMEGLNAGLLQGWADTRRIVGAMNVGLGDLASTRTIRSGAVVAGAQTSPGATYNTYNLYIDGMRVNDDEQVGEIMMRLVRRLSQVGVM